MHEIAVPAYHTHCCQRLELSRSVSHLFPTSPQKRIRTGHPITIVMRCYSNRASYRSHPERALLCTAVDLLGVANLRVSSNASLQPSRTLKESADDAVRLTEK